MTFETGAPGAWQAGNKGTTGSAIRLCRNAGATFQFTDVQLVPGSVALPFRRLLRGEELALCRRYYQQVPVLARGPATGANQYFDVPIIFPTPMRAAPTIGLAGTIAAFNIAAENAHDVTHRGFRYSLRPGPGIPTC